MILVVGLGNPDPHYQGTRHNIGRAIGVQLQTSLGFPAFHLQKKWQALATEGHVGKEKITVLLPQTGMNKSGGAVASAAGALKVKPERIFIVHDDADIALGRTKLSFGKDAAGHKGVESVLKALKTKKVWRFRIGIAGTRDIPAEKLVLKKFTPQEFPRVRKSTKKTIEAVAITIQKGPNKAMNEYNT